MAVIIRPGWIIGGVAIGFAAIGFAGCVDKVDVGSDVDAGVETGTLPERPDESTSSASDATELTFALRDFRFDQSAGAEWRRVGLDLDGFDSLAPDFQGECASLAQAPDGIDGVDNQLGGRLWPVMLAMFPTLNCETTQATAAGFGTLLLTIGGYNGEPDDAHVVAALVRAVDGTADDADCTRFEAGEYDLLDGPPGTGASHASDPDWTAALDAFCANPSDYQGVNGPPILLDQLAYMSEGRLVMTLPPGRSIPLQTYRDTIRITLDQGFLVARLSDDFSAITEGTVAGRWSTSRLLDDLFTMGVCDTSVLADTLNTFADIRSTPDVDATGGLPCDALSVGLPFVGQAAELAGVAPSESRVPFLQNCTEAGPTGVLREGWPIETCCSSFVAVVDEQLCQSHWDAM